MADLNSIDPPRPEDGYERRDVRPRVVIYLGIAVTLTVVGSMVGLRWLEQRQAPEARRNEPAPASDELAPQPRLQANPNRDYVEFAAQQEQLLNSYGWVDREQNIVRIPIAQAIDRAVKEGLPQPKSTQTSKETEENAP